MNAPLICHIDDSLVARKQTAERLSQLEGGYEVKSFESGKAFVEFLGKLPATEARPWLILSDITMPHMGGIEMLRWLKQHPRFHMIPVALLSAETDEELKKQAERLGRWAFIEKPYTPEMLRETVDLRRGQKIDYSSAERLDQTFATEVAGFAEEGHALALDLSAASVDELYRFFHTVKGGARSLQFPTFAEFVHEAEFLLNGIKKHSLFHVKPIAGLSERVVSFIGSQGQKIKTGEPLSAPPADLMRDLSDTVRNIESGLFAAHVTPPKPAGAHLKLVPENGVLSRTSNSVRLSHEKLDELQKRLKHILSLRVRLNGFANQLQAEFHDETFPKELSQMVEELNQEALAIMEYFISLRVVSVTRLGPYAEQIAEQTARQLKKEVGFEFHADESLEVDVTAIECIEQALVHLIRNSIDHGMNANKRGQIMLTLSRTDQDFVRVHLKDDGCGIDCDRLKAAVMAKGIVPEKVLNGMTPEMIHELIFIDGLSTREAVTEVSGRGVGLAAVKSRIVELGGKITVQSEREKGTEFVIEIPRVFHL